MQHEEGAGREASPNLPTVLRWVMLYRNALSPARLESQLQGTTMNRFSVRGAHPATATWGASGLVKLEEVRAAASELLNSGHNQLEVVDHLTKAVTPLEDFLKAPPED